MKLTDIINEEKYTIIDPKGNPAGTGTKVQANQRQKKLGGSKKGYFVVPANKALKARRTLEKYKFDFKSTKLQDLMSDLYFESVNEAKNDDKYVVIDFHEKGGGFVMTKPGSKKDAEDSARSIRKGSDISKREVLKVSDARKIRGLAGKEYLNEESVNEGASTEEKRIVMMAVKKIAKYRNVPLDYAVGDVMRAAQELERDIKKGKIK